MDGLRFTVGAAYPGEGAADINQGAVMPCNATLVSVSAYCGDPGDATLALSVIPGGAAIMAAQALTGADDGLTFDRSDFTGAAAEEGGIMHLTQGQVINWSVDYDGAAGTPYDQLFLLFTFLEG